jgi:membrane protein
MRLKEIPALVADTFRAWREDRAERLAAALSYYTLFSLAPLLIVAVAIAGLVFGEEAARGQIANQFRQMLGSQAAGAVQAMIANAYQPTAGIIATVIGVVTLLIGAAGVFGQIQDAFNTIWHVEPKKSSGIWATIRSRFLSFTMVLGVGFVLMVSLVLSAALSAASAYLGDRLPGSDLLWRALEIGSSVLVVTLLFAMLFKFLPDTEVQWRDVWVGALSTAALFSVGKFLIGLYLGQSSVASTYGAAGSLVVLLLWVYYAAQILFFGAALTRVYAQKYGSRSPAVAGEGVTPAVLHLTVPLPMAQRAATEPETVRGARPFFVHARRPAGINRTVRIATLVGAAIGAVIGFLRSVRQ